MAKKSRRDKMAAELPSQAAQAPEAAGTEAKIKLPTAAYARLSMENSGHETEDSIQTQVMLIHEFIKNHPDLKLTDTYIDNGFTGTNFDRPEFERMMRDVYSGRIQCIVVKDLSRFGRDYIETGHYMETIFPRLNIRFIAVTDNFDNARKEDRESLAVPIKNMVNGFYAKDISRKLSSNYEMRQQNGEIIASRSPYGYQIDREHNCLVPNEELAVYVRGMFFWLMMGNSRTEIARRLDLVGAPRPMERFSGGADIYKKKKRQGWTSDMVTGILRNRAHAGDRISGKTQVALYKGIKVAVKPEDEWYVHENAHIPLVPRPVFDAAQQMMDESCEFYRKNRASISQDKDACPGYFKGLLYCPDCKKPMLYRRIRRFDESAPHGIYSCGTIKGMCPNGSRRYNEKMLMIMVMDQIKLMAKMMIDHKKLAQQMMDETEDRNSAISVQKKLDSLSFRINESEKRRTKAYEDFAEGLLTQEEYQYLKERYISDKQKLEQQMQELVQAKEQMFARGRKVVEQAKHYEQYLDCCEFDEKLVRALVRRIYIGPDDTLEVIFKFEDVFQEFLKRAKEVTGGE